MTEPIIVPPSKTTPEALARTLTRGGDQPDVTLYEGDCRTWLAKMDDASIHLAVTDPPYFLDRLDDRWDHAGIAHSRKNAGVVGGLPVGMKFDPAQGHRLQAFIGTVASELFRVLKPGSFLLMFAQPRLMHRAAVALEDKGFEIRDVYAWHYPGTAQFKAFSVNHFVRRRPNMTDKEKADAIDQLDDRRTPQLRPEFDTIICARKPIEGTLADNWLKYETGLIDARQTLTGRSPGTVMNVGKTHTDSSEDHPTPKPVKLCEHLIRLFSAPGQTVIDPFVGSGTTCLAARRAGRHSIGIDVNARYIQQARERLEGAVL